MTEDRKKDVRVKITVRNNLILAAVEAAGYKSLRAFCQHHPEINYVSALNLVGMRARPTRRIASEQRLPGGVFDWSPTAKGLAAALGVEESELFSTEQVEMSPLKSNTATLAMAAPDARGWLTGHAEEAALPPDRKLIRASFEETVEEVIDTLSPRERLVLTMRFGVCGESKHTLEEVANKLNVTRERIRQIESKAVRLMRHPARAGRLKPYLREEGISS